MFFAGHFRIVACKAVPVRTPIDASPMTRSLQIRSPSADQDGGIGTENTSRTEDGGLDRTLLRARTDRRLPRRKTPDKIQNYGISLRRRGCGRFRPGPKTADAAAGRTKSKGRN